MMVAYTPAMPDRLYDHDAISDEEVCASALARYGTLGSHIVSDLPLLRGLDISVRTGCRIARLDMSKLVIESDFEDTFTVSDIVNYNELRIVHGGKTYRVDHFEIDKEVGPEPYSRDDTVYATVKVLARLAEVR